VLSQHVDPDYKGVREGSRKGRCEEARLSKAVIRLTWLRRVHVDALYPLRAGKKLPLPYTEVSASVLIVSPGV
jgi:hypothetical protein